MWLFITYKARMYVPLHKTLLLQKVYFSPYRDVAPCGAIDTTVRVRGKNPTPTPRGCTSKEALDT